MELVEVECNVAYRSGAISPNLFIIFYVMPSFSLLSFPFPQELKVEGAVKRIKADKTLSNMNKVVPRILDKADGMDDTMGYG